MVRSAVLALLASAVRLVAADQTADIQKRFDQACESNKFMGAASLAVNGKTVFSGACGLANAGWNVRNTVDTRFRIASITKEFTAAAILLQLEEKRFLLTDAIGKYVADLPDSWRSATIHQLLTHTSGVPIYTASPDLSRIERFEATPNQLLDIVRDKPLLYPHGTKLTYNNTGYILLGLLIEKVSGTSYSQFVQERIFNHLGMKDSGFDFTHKVVAGKAQGYALAGGELQNADFVDITSAWSAGGFYSTVGDLTIWSEALGHGRLLNAESTDRMFRVYPETVLQGAHYGYGVVLVERFGHKLQYHGGGITGYSSVLQRYPEVGLVVSVLSNLDLSPGVLPSWTLGDDLAKIWFAAQSQ
jgi:D-alanyl-D-alanine carboxypeptidase